MMQRWNFATRIVTNNGVHKRRNRSRSKAKAETETQNVVKQMTPPKYVTKNRTSKKWPTPDEQRKYSKDFTSFYEDTEKIPFST